VTRTAVPAPSLTASLDGPAYPGTALLSLAASYIVLGVGSLSIIGLIGPMSRDLGVSHAAIAQLVTVFALTYALAAPLLQVLVGDLPRRRLILVGLMLLALGSALVAVSSSFQLVALSRMLMAIGGALVGPMASAAGASLVTPEHQGRALGTVFGGMTVATVLGVPLSSWLGSLFDWREANAAVAVAAIIAGVLVRWTVPAGQGGAPPTLRTLGAVLADRVLAPAVGVTLLRMAAQFATYALVGVFLAERAGFPLSLLPAALVVFGIGGILGNTVAARLADRIGADRTILVSLAALGAVFAALIVMPPLPWLGFALLAA